MNCNAERVQKICTVTSTVLSIWKQAHFPIVRFILAFVRPVGR